MPISLTSMPGASVAWVTSSTIAASGSSEKALVREPPKVVSSCVAATAASSHSEPPASATSRAASSATKEPMRLSSARETSAPVEQLGGLGVDHGDVADTHVLARLLAVGRADVDVQLADLGDLLALLVAQQVDRLLADDAPDRAALRVLEHDALADEDLRVPAADFGEPQVAVVVDVRDDQADLVDVPHHEQARRGRRSTGALPARCLAPPPLAARPARAECRSRRC